MQDPNVEELAEKIVAAGGKKRMEDPFGNILEIYSHSYELVYSEVLIRLIRKALS